MSSRRKRMDLPLSQREVPETLTAKVRPPLCVVLGSPAEVVNLLRGLGDPGAVCYQMDVHQAEKLRNELQAAGLNGKVTVAPDLWDLPAEFASAVYLSPRGGERELKLDMVEQGFHVLRPRGTLLVWSPYQGDLFFPKQLKKVFGRAHSTHVNNDSIFWAQRDGERPRRRHELTFQVKIADGPSFRFASRPGTFSYGRFDDGARALVEVARIEPGERILDFGCGAGTNGSFAWQRAAPDGFIAFIDSNTRAIALTEQNAKANGVANYQTFTSAAAADLKEGSFDVALANPPYYAIGAIAKLFINRSKALLKEDGRLYLVTRQPTEIAPLMVEAFGEIDAVEHRGYTVLSARTDGEYQDRAPL